MLFIVILLVYFAVATKLPSSKPHAEDFVFDYKPVKAAYLPYDEGTYLVSFRLNRLTEHLFSVASPEAVLTDIRLQPQ